MEIGDTLYVLTAGLTRIEFDFLMEHRKEHWVWRINLRGGSFCVIFIQRIVWTKYKYYTRLQHYTLKEVLKKDNSSQKIINF